MLFTNKAYPKAQAAYEAVIKIGASSAFYNQSLYKHGWSLFKQGENERSLDSFAGVLDSVLISKRDPGGLVELESLTRPNRELVEDTFRVMSITFSYLDGPKTIDDFVKHRKPRPYSYLLYARLGDLYMEKERYTDAADSYRAFVSQDRNNEKAPLLEMQAIEAYSKGRVPAARACRAKRSSSRTTASAPRTGRAGIPRRTASRGACSRPISRMWRSTTTRRRSAPRTWPTIRRRRSGTAAISPRFRMTRNPP